MKKYYFIKNNQKFGPFSLEEFLEKDFENDALIWFDGLSEWKKFSTFPDLVSQKFRNPPPVNHKKNYESKSTFNSKFIISIIILIIALVTFFFFFYPSFEARNKYDKSLDQFKRTGSISHEVFKELSDNNYPEAIFILGLYHFYKDDTINAKEMFEKARLVNNEIPSIFYLNLINGRSQAKQIDKNNLDKWARSIEKTDWLNQIIAGSIYFSGKDGEKRLFIKKAKEYFELAANNGSVEAMNLLGIDDFYDSDTLKTVYWLKKSSQLGYGNAMAGLAARYFKISDLNEANKWLSLSIQNKSTYGYYLKGLVYKTKLGSNIDSAKYYFEIASKNKFDITPNHKFYKALAIEGIEGIEKEKAVKIESEKKAKEALINDKAISKNSGMIECFYCGRVFNLTQGYTKNMNDCADSYNIAMGNLAIARYVSEIHYNFVYNSIKFGEWYCSRRCVHESGYCISSF